MEIVDLKKKTDIELAELLKKQKEELRALRFQAANNQLKTVHQIRLLRTDIARVKTIINQRRDGESSTKSSASAAVPSASTDNPARV